MLRRLGKGLILAGFATFVASVVWWYLFFEQLLKEDVKRASACFYQTTTECALGNMFISTFGDIPVYDPELLWLAGGLTGLGMMLMGVKRGVEPERTLPKEDRK